MNHSESLYTQVVEELKIENAQLKQKLADLTKEHIEIESILNCIADGVLVYDKDGRIVRSNAAAEKILKLQNREKNLTLKERLPKKYKVYTENGHQLGTEEMPAYKAAVKGETSMNNLFLIETEDQSTWVNLSAAPLIVNGNHNGGIISLSDVSSRKLAEQNLVRERELFEGIFNNIPVMIIIYDPELKNFQLNKIFKQITGWAEDSANRNDIMRFVFPDPAYRQEVSKFMKNLDPGWKELNMTSKHGEIIETSWATIKLTSGIFIGIGIDIRERKKAEQALRKSEGELRNSEERFRLLADNISQIAWIANNKGEILWFNKRWYDYTGLTPEQSKSRGKITHPEHAERVLKSYYNALNSANDWEDIYPILGKDGEYRWFLGRAMPIRNDNGEVTLWFGTNTDITEQKKIEDELRKKEQRLQAMFNNAAIGIIEADRFDNILDVNSQLCNILGYEKHELIGKSISDLTLEEDRENSDKMNENLHKGEFKLFKYEKRYIKKDGTPIWVNVSVSAIHDSKGNYINSIGIVENISDRKQFEEDLRKSEESLKLIIEAAELGTWDFDIDTGIAEHSFRHDQIFGYSEPQQEWSYEISIKHILPEFEPVVREAYERALKTGALNYEAKVKWPDGTIHWIAPHGRVQYSHERKPLRMAGIVSDVTERKTAEEAVKESEETFSKMFHALPIGVSLATYPDEKLSNVNKAWLDLAEYSDLKEVFGKTKVELGVITSQDMERINSEFNLYGNVRNAETIFYSKTGQQNIININKDFIHIGGNKFVLSTNEDITNQKKYEQEIKQKNEELTRFIYTVSHDLKSPLVTIKSFTSYLKEDIEANDKTVQDKDIGYIENAADKMGRLLDELLELSRIGRKEEPKTEVSLEIIVKTALDLTAGRISQRKVNVNITAPSVMLFGFSQRLIQLFQNLIDNAVKFMGDQTDPLVEIGAFHDDQKNEVVIYVRDNGSGIDPRYHHKIFGLFEKMDNKTEGSGIGLALVKRIVEVHEGSIWFESEGVGKGTTFYFTLKNTHIAK